MTHEDRVMPDTGPFKDRLARVIGLDSVSAFAKKCGVGESLLRSYLSGRSLPGLEAVTKIAAASGTNSYWLVTGMGSWTPNDGAEVRRSGIREGVDLDVLEMAIEYVDSRLRIAKKRLRPRQFAHAVRLAYELSLDERKISPERIDSVFGLLEGS